MATEAYLNIKQLPQIKQVNNGSFILVETPDGTSIVDFKDFILPPENTTFATQLSGGSEAKTYTDTLVAKISTEIDKKLDEVTNVFTDHKRVTMNKGSSSGTTIQTTFSKLVPNVLTIRTSDIIISPGNEVATLSGAYVDSVDNNVITDKNGSNSGKMITVTLKSPFYFTSSVPAVFNIALIKNY